jgi:hypothetical protein
MMEPFIVHSRSGQKYFVVLLQEIGSKKQAFCSLRNNTDDNLRLAQQALHMCMLFYVNEDQERRLQSHVTVKFGKDNRVTNSGFVDGSHEDTSSERI